MRKKLNSVAKWSDLPPEMLGEIAIKLVEIADFTTFRGVCSSWRAATAMDIFKSPKLPLLMLSDFHYRDCKFYSLSTNKIRKAAVPGAEGKRCTDARFGWILAVAPKGSEDCLFKPFSSSPAIPLPNFPRVYRCTNTVRKAILTANPSQTSDFMVFAFDTNHDLGFWKNGDNNWTRIETGLPYCVLFMSIGYCGHKMYAIDSAHSLWSWDPSATHLSQLLTLGFLAAFRGMPYVMESTAGELLVITRGYSLNTDYVVFRIDVEKREWEVMSGDMGKEAIFCSAPYAAVSVAANDFAGLIQPNSVYLAEDGKDVRVSNFEDMSIIQRLDTKSSGHSIWVFP